MPKPITVNQSQSLPSLKTCGLPDNALTLWNELLKAESTALSQLETQSSDHGDPLIGIRVLGFLLKDLFDHAWMFTHEDAYNRLCLEISSCFFDKKKDDSDEEAVYDAIVDLGLSYRNNFFHVFRSNRGDRSTTPSQHPSRFSESLDVIQDRIIQELDDIVPPTRSGIQNQALMRDGYKCVLTGLYDTQSCQNIEEIDNASISEQVGMTYTEVAHVFSESACYDQEDDDDDDDERYPSSSSTTTTTTTRTRSALRTILKLFGLENRLEELSGPKINTLPNVLTMSRDLHTAFDLFDLWLEPVPHQKNTYDIQTIPTLRGGRFYLPFPDRITLSVDPRASATAATAAKFKPRANNKEHKELPLPLPDPSLIAIRATWARVANLSGAAEQAEKITEKLECLTVMEGDGGTGGLLAARLNLLMV